METQLYYVYEIHFLKLSRKVYQYSFSLGIHFQCFKFMKFLQYMRHYSKSEIFDEQYLYFKRWFVQFLHNCVEDFLFVPNSVESF